MDYITWMWWALSQSFSYTAAYYCRCIMLKMWNPLKNQNLNELVFMKCRSDLEIQCSKKLSDGNVAQASEQIGAWMLQVKTTINCVINEMSQWPKRKLFQVALHLMASQLAAFITPEQRRHFWLNCYHSQHSMHSGKWAGQKSRKSQNAQMS